MVDDDRPGEVPQAQVADMEVRVLGDKVKEMRCPSSCGRQLDDRSIPFPVPTQTTVIIIT